jgi:DNA-binding IclR family transcriptional regulator
LPATHKPYYAIGSLQKGMRALEVLVERGPLSVSEAAKLLGQNRSAVHRFFATWRDMGYVVQDSANRYRATLKVFSLGHKVVNHLEVRPLARPLMSQLHETHGESVNLGCLDNREVVVIDMIKSRKVLKYDLPVGSRGPAYAAALGKALLAFANPDQLENYIKSLETGRRTPHTLTDRQIIKDELERVRKQGYALDDEEWAMGIRCVAAPVLDYQGRAIYALSVSGPVQRMSRKKIDDILSDLLPVAKSLSWLLGADASTDEVT